jgi:hypothetical protein
MMMHYLAIAALVAAAPIVHGAPSTGNDSQAANDATKIKLLTAQIHAVQRYVSCLENAGDGGPCEPPRPLQLPPTLGSPSDRPFHIQANMDSAKHDLIELEARATRAHVECVRKRRDGCGPPP